LGDLDIRKLGFFCPFCGVKNNAGQTQCFVCGKKVPSFDADASPVPTRARTISGASKALSTGAGGAVAARIGDRMIAIFLDTILIAAVMLFLYAVASTEKLFAGLPLSPTGFIAAGSGVVVLIAFLYHWLLEGSSGVTLGKGIIGVRVASMGGRRGGFQASAIRNAIRIVEGIPLYIPAFAVALFTKGRRRIGDLAANTVVLEHDLSVAARAAVVIGWLAIIGASLWGTYMIAPEWFRLPHR